MQGLRVAADCPGAIRHERLVWPLPLEAWLPPQERRAQRLPAVDTHCPPLQQGSSAPLIVTGVIEGQIVKPLPGNSTLTIPVAVQGGQGTQRWWFLNGEPLMTQNAAEMSLHLDHPGEYQLVVMDEEGQLVSVTFSRG